MQEVVLSQRRIDVVLVRRCRVRLHTYIVCLDPLWLGLFTWSLWIYTYSINNVCHQKLAIAEGAFFCEEKLERKATMVMHPCFQKMTGCCFPEPLVMCTHALIKMNGWLNFLPKARWGETVIKCKVILQMSCSCSGFPWFICWQHSLDRFVTTVFPCHTVAVDCTSLSLWAQTIQKYWVFKSVWLLCMSIFAKDAKNKTMFSMSI